MQLRMLRQTRKPKTEANAAAQENAAEKAAAEKAAAEKSVAEQAAWDAFPPTILRAHWALNCSWKRKRKPRSTALVRTSAKHELQRKPRGGARTSRS